MLPAISAAGFRCEPHYDETGTLRIKATCPRCGVFCIGNKDDIVKWENQHHCAVKAVAADWCRCRQGRGAM